MKTLQDFRNYMQVIAYREWASMQVSNDTRRSNLINELIDYMDYEFGTEWQETEPVRQAEAKLRQKAVDAGNEQMAMF